MILTNKKSLKLSPMLKTGTTVSQTQFTRRWRRNNIMIRSEDLKCNEDLLVIWGFRFPTAKIESKQAIHHALLLINNMAIKGNFRIVYFHTGVKGAGEKIPSLLKKI
mmetsp:Transcript_26538/g.26409  ORF Transcript_26538/g.26409 Transcript_26538/m.26409 type:complete len:107 (+) Transcript_26538:75-395(+)